MGQFADRLYALSPPFVQNAVVSAYGARARRDRFGAAFDRAIEFLERSERWSRAELRAYQDERVGAIVAHAYETVAFYRERMDALGLAPRDVRSVDDLPKLPIVTRADLAAHGARMVTTATPRPRLWSVTTSGTTGAPVSVRWDHGVVVMTNACLWRARRWAGFEFGRPYATLLGRLVVPAEATRPPYWRVNRSWNQLLLSPLHVTAETATRYLEAMRDFGVEALEAYPSSAYVLARHARAARGRLNLRAVFTTSEPLLPAQREVIEERFGCRVFDAYGQAERVMFSSECEAHDGHHLFEQYGVTEIVDDRGAPVHPGSPGRVVATSLHNLGMPLIRYELRDATAMAARSCPCGRTLALTKGVATKEEDLLVAEDGRLVSPSLLTGVFKDALRVAESQIVQRERGEVTVRIVRLDGYTDDDERLIAHGLRARLGERATVRFEYVSDIPRSARGKFRWVISTAPVSWGRGGGGAAAL